MIDSNFLLTYDVRKVGTDVICQVDNRHLFVVDYNKYNGLAFVRFPRHDVAVSVLGDVFKSLQDDGTITTLINSPWSLNTFSVPGVHDA